MQIVDEHTGRIMHEIRYNIGSPSLKGKERAIEKETQTVNYHGSKLF